MIFQTTGVTNSLNLIVIYLVLYYCFRYKVLPDIIIASSELVLCMTGILTYFFFTKKMISLQDII